jgi:hypothetical protein
VVLSGHLSLWADVAPSAPVVPPGCTVLGMQKNDAAGCYSGVCWRESLDRLDQELEVHASLRCGLPYNRVAHAITSRRASTISRHDVPG